MTDVPGDVAPYFLAHPIYLDESMMLSFLAHLDGGVAAQSDEEEASTSSSTSGGSLRAGIRAKLMQFASAELSAEGRTESTNAGQTQIRRSRQHTAASLFNLLYQYLHEDAALKVVSSKADLDDLRAGSLVQFEGSYEGNPLEEVVRLMDSVLQLETKKEEQNTSSKPSSKSGSPAKRAAAAALEAHVKQASGEATDTNASGVAIIRQMVVDIDQGPMHDLLLEVDDELQAVVVASSEYFSNATNEALRSGRVQVLGKVTRILHDEETINLTRRTILGAGGPDLATQTVVGVSSAMPGLKVTSPIVTAPAMQVVPMAIFV